MHLVKLRTLTIVTFFQQVERPKRLVDDCCTQVRFRPPEAGMARRSNTTPVWGFSD